MGPPSTKKIVISCLKTGRQETRVETARLQSADFFRARICTRVLLHDTYHSRHSRMMRGNERKVDDVPAGCGKWRATRSGPVLDWTRREKLW